MDKQKIVDAILSSKNYNFLAPTLVARIVTEEMAKFKKEKDVIKHAKNKLHQYSDMFFDNTAIKNLSESDLTNNQTILNLLNAHKSTSERLTFANELFADVFNVCKNASSVIDLGCGLNPLFVSQVDVLQNKNYLAIDVNTLTTTLLNKFFVANGINGKAEALDILTDIPNTKFDVALMFKLAPLLERQKKGSVADILKKLIAKYVVVSFPLVSVRGNTNTSMEQNYKTYFANFANTNNLKLIFQKVYTNEAVFIIENL